MKLKGIPVVRGYTFGEVFIIDTNEEFEGIEVPIEQLEALISGYTNYLLEEVEGMDEKYKEYAKFYINLLKSPSFISSVKSKGNNVIKAISLVIDELSNNMLSLNDEHYKSISDELKFFKNEFLDFIRGKIDDLKIRENSIIVAKNLTVRQSLKVVKSNIRGAILETFALTSHPVLILKDKGIPTIIGVENAVNIAKNYKYAILNNDEVEFTSQALELEIKSPNILHMSDEIETRDGLKVKIQLNIDFPAEVENVKNFDIGLFRTEYLYLNGIISKSEQKDIYEYMSEKIYPKILTIRLFDLGEDKVPISLESTSVRGIRYLLHYNRELLNRQISAIKLANKLKNIRILIPMVSSIEEVIQVRKLVEDIDIGIMVETPSSALITDRFKKYVQFFSLGTNDLSQYTLAINRNDISFQQFHPSIFRLIYYSFSKSKPKPFSVCGDMASSDLGLIALISFGIRIVSIPISYISRAIEIIEKLDKQTLTQISRKIITAYREEEILKCLNYYLDIL
ncbi:MAG: putative PEP-binding protein [candidate division WOR-3 bacterium]